MGRLITREKVLIRKNKYYQYFLEVLKMLQWQIYNQVIFFLSIVLE